ncbi:MAG: hypothetical protein AB1505_02580 [Candidatus Latescibacterota bacterium]
MLRLLLLVTAGMLWEDLAPSHAATRSPHRALARDCGECHSTAGWQEIRFEHAATGFDLEGGHARLGCLQCHIVEDFARAASSCQSCHPDYHQGHLGSQCQQCHEPASWRPSAFDHALTAFPLSGAHGAVDCVQCHPNEVTYQLAGEPQTCLDCHERDFTRARVAVHLTAGSDCETCHTLDTWQGGHDPAWFEIRSGRHEAACAGCHKHGDDCTRYTCTDCHELELEVDEHRGLDPQDGRCLECHAHGFEDD